MFPLQGIERGHLKECRLPPQEQTRDCGRPAAAVPAGYEACHSEDARHEPSGRCTVVEIFATESMNEGFLLNMDPVEKSHTYRDKDYQQAQIVRKVDSKTEERKQTACVCRMANKAIDSLFDHSVAFPYRHIYRELMLQRKDGEPANKQSTDDESDTSNGKYPGSKFNVPDSLQADKDA